MRLLLLFVVCWYNVITEAHKPISPKEWQKLAGPGGFATSWFRSVEGFENKYRKKNIEDVYNKGFRNLRLRCRTGYPKYDMERQVRELEVVVDDCLEGNVVPIVCWLNHKSEAEATDDQMKAYVKWWKTVATKLKGKDYRLAFNLFEEIGLEKNPGPHCERLNEIAKAKDFGEHYACPVVGGESLRENLDKYIEWTKAAVKTIREIDPHRIIILGSPRKTGEYLKLIPSEIYSNDKYMMAEWHIYASGPSKAFLDNGKPVTKYWKGQGSKYGKKNVDKNLAHARKWTEETGILTYFGAWMPQDNIKAKIKMFEAKEFIKYFVGQVKAMGIPWTLNAIEIYYNTATCEWYEGPHEHRGMHITQTMNWSELLLVTQSTMNAPAPPIAIASGGIAGIEGEEINGGKKGKKEKRKGKGGNKGGSKGDKRGGKKGKKGGKKGDFQNRSIYEELVDLFVDEMN